MGAICKLVDQKSNNELVINVEYNQLDALLQPQGGDVVGPDGTYSAYPGNTNTLLFQIPPYCDNLEKTKGVIPEFVNPKYANAEKTAFKSATRLECMMQDYPKLIEGKNKVGFTTYPPWYCFSPAKTSLADSIKK